MRWRREKSTYQYPAPILNTKGAPFILISKLTFSLNPLLQLLNTVVSVVVVLLALNRQKAEPPNLVIDVVCPRELQSCPFTDFMLQVYLRRAVDVLLNHASQDSSNALPSV